MLLKFETDAQCASAQGRENADYELFWSVIE